MKMHTSANLDSQMQAYNTISFGHNGRKIPKVRGEPDESLWQIIRV